MKKIPCLLAGDISVLLIHAKRYKLGFLVEPHIIHLELLGKDGS
jgi:hypothetical protein